MMQIKMPDGCPDCGQHEYICRGYEVIRFIDLDADGLFVWRRFDIPKRLCLECGRNWTGRLEGLDHQFRVSKRVVEWVEGNAAQGATFIRDVSGLSLYQARRLVRRFS